MDANAVYAFLEWAAKAVASAGIVLAAVWRILNGMISKKIQEQLSTLSREITRVNTQQMDQLREELRTRHDEQREDMREIRQRVDDLMDRTR